LALKVLQVNSERHVDDCVNAVVRGIEAPEVDVEAAGVAKVAIAKAHVEEIKGHHREHKGHVLKDLRFAAQFWSRHGPHWRRFPKTRFHW